MAVHPGEEMIDILSEGEPDMSHMDYDLEYSVRVGKTEYVRKLIIIMDYLYRGTALPCSGVDWVVSIHFCTCIYHARVSIHGHFNITHDFGPHRRLPGIVCLPGTLRVYTVHVHCMCA